MTENKMDMFDVVIKEQPWILTICGNESFEEYEFIEALREFWDVAQEAARKEDAINTYNLQRKA